MQNITKLVACNFIQLNLQCPFFCSCVWMTALCWAWAMDLRRNLGAQQPDNVQSWNIQLTTHGQHYN